MDGCVIVNIGAKKESLVRVVSSVRTLGKKTSGDEATLVDRLNNLLNTSKQVELSTIRKVAEARKLMQEVKGKVKEEFIEGQPN